MMIKEWRWQGRTPGPPCSHSCIRQGRSGQSLVGRSLGSSCCPGQSWSLSGWIKQSWQSGSGPGAPSSWLEGDREPLACPLQPPAPSPAPGVEEPRLSREAPGESKSREEPE